MSRVRIAASLACLIAVAAIATGGCSPPRLTVTQYGAMREVLMDGQTEGRIDLAVAARAPHSYGIGALQGLSGEITIVDGEVWVARASQGDVTVTGPGVVASDRAALLTLASVEKWRSHRVAEPVEDGALETLIERLARQGGIDTSSPFPFLVDGELTRLDVHVVAGSCPAHAAGEETWRASFTEPIRDTLVGFFAKGQEGIMTHHGSSIHVHALLPHDGGMLTGHVDHVAISVGATLRLP